MIALIERTIVGLGKRPIIFETRRKMCVGCDRSKPLETKKCGQCRGEEFRPINCDTGSRICEFLNRFESVQLFPLIEKIGQSPREFRATLRSAPLTNHTCEGDFICPLVLAMKSLEATLAAKLSESSGLDLWAYKARH